MKSKRFAELTEKYLKREKLINTYDIMLFKSNYY